VTMRAVFVGMDGAARKNGRCSRCQVVGVGVGVSVGVMCMCVFFMPHVLVSCPRMFVGCNGWHNMLNATFRKT
jgi:hypothetical protein